MTAATTPGKTTVTIPDVNFSAPQEYIITSTQKVNLFLAGVGSGKTYIIGFLSGYYITNFPEVFGFIGANTYMQLNQSTLFRVRTVWREMFGWEEGRDYVVGVNPPKTFDTSNHEFDKYTNIISFKHGAIVFIGSMEKAKAHDGKEFGWAFLDETKDTREHDVKEIILARLRAPGIYIDKHGQLTDQKYDEEEHTIVNRNFQPLYITTSPAKVDWLNEWFELDEDQDRILDLIYDEESFYVNEKDNRCVVISSTYHNQENLPSTYISDLLDNLGKERAGQLVYGNPFVKSGGEFYSTFDRNKHVGDWPHKPGLPIHITFDQNVKPYITATLWQAERDTDGVLWLTQFDEVCLENPRNKTNKLCYEIIRRWAKHMETDKIFIYGDPSGRKSDTRGLEHDYDIIFRILRPYLGPGFDRVPHKHPPVIKRRDFICDTFEEVPGVKVRIRINRTCKKSIGDFEHVKEDENGKKKKEIFEDPITKDRYEKRGHTSDSADYFICKVAEPDFLRHR